jgi:hypothetical protein
MQLKHPFCDIHSNHDTIHVGPSAPVKTEHLPPWAL